MVCGGDDGRLLMLAGGQPSPYILHPVASLVQKKVTVSNLGFGV